MQKLDTFLNGITMYCLMLWYLKLLFAAAVILSFFHILPFNPLDILTDGIYLIAVCFIANQILGLIFNVKPNYESQFISGFILALIIGPLPLLPNLFFLTITPIFAMASKYLVAYHRQHIFNPAAFAVFLTAVIFGKGASWWIGNLNMAPFVILGGLIILRKLHLFNLTFAFLMTFLAFLSLSNLNFLFDLNIFFASSVLFFSFVMLTEPITSPTDKTVLTYYGIFTAFIFIILQRFFNIPYTLELSLLVANLAGRIVQSGGTYTLMLKKKREIAPTLWEFIFEPLQPIHYKAGQYLEWNLPHSHPDSRGSRRYFTIASSPTEKEIILAVKIPEKSSSFKSALKSLSVRESIHVRKLAGDFIQPQEVDKQYVFIAGGIGITPFRSIIKHLLDTNTSLSIVLFYTASSKEFIFEDIFTQARQKTGLRIIYVISGDCPKSWQGETGYITCGMLRKYVKNFTQAIYYLSGPQPMVVAYANMLKENGIRKSQIKTDYFPGYTQI
ncbi:hypothetical protein HYW41_02650 [Candidatus Daviesbacteria bacterium]|nr:hypothetical protein [Candidatus Daviesbacteria bacterium]